MRTPSVLSIRKAVLTTGALFSIVAFLFSATTVRATSELNVSLAEIPPRSEIGPDGHVRGVYVELFQMLDEVFEEVSLTIGVFPFARSYNNVKVGKADMHFPMVSSYKAETHYYVPEPLLFLPLVLYSRVDDPLRPDDDMSGKILEGIGGGMNEVQGVKIRTENDPRMGLKNCLWAGFMVLLVNKAWLTEFYVKKV